MLEKFVNAIVDLLKVKTYHHNSNDLYRLLFSFERKA